MSGSKTADTRSLYVLALMLAAAAAIVEPAAAQPQSSPATGVVRGDSEWTATAAVAHGISVLQSNGGQRYAMPTLSWGRVLTDARGPGWMRGRFEWIVEVSPLFVEWSGGQARGAGVAPLGWRWNLEPRGRVQPFAEVGGGALWTTQPIPAGTTGSNFTTHAGIGARVLGRSGHGVIAGYRLHHISNGNRIGRNPGVNAHLLFVGWTHAGRAR